MVLRQGKTLNKYSIGVQPEHPIGTIFIACEESDITPEYKQAMIDYGEKTLSTTKLSGSPLTVINTPYVQQLGTKANLLELILNNNKTP